jgi:hypothetical protein
VYGPSFVRRVELGASGGAGEGKAEVVGNAAADKEPDGDGVTSVEAVELKVCPVVVVSIESWELWCAPSVTLGGDDVCGSIGRPISATGPLDLRGRDVAAALLNICGILARLKELAVLPSGGCSCWNDSNSVNNVFRLLR